MTEETVKLKRIKCDLCGYKEEVEVKDKFLARPKTPETWGSDFHNKDQMCPVCKKGYMDGYRDWYNTYKANRKNKDGK